LETISYSDKESQRHLEIEDLRARLKISQDEEDKLRHQLLRLNEQVHREKEVNKKQAVRVILLIFR